MNARDAVRAWMQARQIRYLFGNPGSTELPMLTALPPEARYVLALHEGVAVAMADGYAQATGRPALVNLHVAPGLGNAMGALFTARKNHSPVVVTAGQQDTRHLLLEPLLAGNVVEMARPLVKWTHEVIRAADLPVVLEQAYQMAATPPTGPVFVSIPMNLWEGEAEPVPLRHLEPPGPPQGLGRLARALEEARAPALVIGAGVDRAGGWGAAVRLAEALGAPVYSDPIGHRIGFPTDHPLFRGMLPAAAPLIAQALQGHDLVLVAGAPFFLTFPYLPGPFLAPGTRAYLITDDPDEAARAPASGAFVGDVAAALAALAEQAVPRGGVGKAAAASAATGGRTAGTGSGNTTGAANRERLNSAHVLSTLGRRLPPETVVVDETSSSFDQLRIHVPIRRPGAYFTAASGGLGWAMPAAIGLKLASPDRPVVAVVGDGSSMYAIQALWTAAREGLPITYVVLNNASYTILKSFAQAVFPQLAGSIPGLELPDLDLVIVARGMGVTAERVEGPESLEAALDRALESKGPYLLDVQIDREVPSLL